MCRKNSYRDMTLKTKFQNFHIQFLNSDFSVDNESNVTKLKGYVPCILLEERMSQNFDLGPSYFFMLCRKCVSVSFYVLCHKNKTSASINIWRHAFLDKNILEHTQKVLNVYNI